MQPAYELQAHLGLVLAWSWSRAPEYKHGRQCTSTLEYKHGRLVTSARVRARQAVTTRGYECVAHEYVLALVAQ